MSHTQATIDKLKRAADGCDNSAELWQIARQMEQFDWQEARAIERKAEAMERQEAESVNA